MKKILIIAAVASFLSACNNNASEGFDLTIDIPSAGNSHIKVTSLEGDSLIYEGNLSDGSLTANLSNVDHQIVMIQVMELGQPGIYFHDGSNVSITYNDSSGLNIDAGAMNDSLKVLNSRYDFFLKTQSVLEEKFMKAMNEGDLKVQEQIRQEAMNLEKSLERQQIEFAKRNDILGASIILAPRRSPVSYDDFKAVLDQVSPEYFESKQYLKLKEQVEVLSHSEIGMQIKDFAQTSAKGGTLNILGVDGKYVLIDFWASWCGPCRKSNPALVELYNTHHDAGFNILGVSLDRDGAEWQKGIKEDGLPWPQISDLQYWQNEISTYYGIQFIPQNILIDDNGIIIAKNMEPAQLGEFLSNNL